MPKIMGSPETNLQFAHDVNLAHGACSACIAKGCGIRWGRKTWVAHDKGRVVPSWNSSKNRVNNRFSWPFKHPSMFCFKQVEGGGYCMPITFLLFFPLDLNLSISTWFYVILRDSTWRCELQGVMHHYQSTFIQLQEEDSDQILKNWQIKDIGLQAPEPTWTTWIPQHFASETVMNIMIFAYKSSSSEITVWCFFWCFWWVLSLSPLRQTPRNRVPLHGSTFRATPRPARRSSPPRRRCWRWCGFRRRNCCWGLPGSTVRWTSLNCQFWPHVSGISVYSIPLPCSTHSIVTVTVDNWYSLMIAVDNCWYTWCELRPLGMPRYVPRVNRFAHSVGTGLVAARTFRRKWSDCGELSMWPRRLGLDILDLSWKMLEIINSLMLEHIFL